MIHQDPTAAPQEVTTTERPKQAPPGTPKNHVLRRLSGNMLRQAPNVVSPEATATTERLKHLPKTLPKVMFR